jgi:hypothetical protein
VIGLDFNTNRRSLERNDLARNLVVQYARVMDISAGRPIIRFSGEEENSSKIYSHLKSYIPTISDRVILLNDVIIGGF